MIKLIKKYEEGLRIYHCYDCKHNFGVPRGKTKVKCTYCGEELKEKKL